MSKSKSKRKDRQSSESEGAPEWMVTYSDLVTLLLTFFIMLFSMATIDKQKFIQVAFSLQSKFLHISNGENFDYNKGKKIISVIEQNNTTDQSQSTVNNQQKDPSAEQRIIDAAEALKIEKLNEIKDQIEEEIGKLQLEDFVSIIEEKTSLILRLNSLVLFDSGQADIKLSGKESLKKFGIILKQLENNIQIIGHTDNIPINTIYFPSNWELSTRRATNVVLFLQDECQLDPEKLTASGNGEYQPIAPNDTEEDRQKNRRIDIVIEK